MKVVILAGGLGTRISEESHLKPKPMIDIGEQPILWHIMKSYSYYGYNEFIICCGYKGHIIKKYFSDYYLHRSDITFDFSTDNTITIHSNVAEPWKVTVVDTGLNTMTGGRVKRIEHYIREESFMLTYGDGISDVNLNELERFHSDHGKIATITAIQPGGRFGIIDIDTGGVVTNFKEKKKEDGGWINGGFMVLKPEIFKLIDDDQTVFEEYPLEQCAHLSELVAYKHHGFWQCMDTLREKKMLEELVITGKAPWIKW
ncbi:glucose-1-phosphate cytidylyltransferase [Acetobacterium wieringae]|uniref:Glucose-1-phosphate cytidylyltransferase n=1 Tax=Acetobacterium wieringae TaxID=52694 RepID=A0A1F2PGM2_9FIRM|nr:glucose-1-phosphate cytidylyltransferase [Acetobacterium wieringae]OFV70022.1 glucose-1-phosphate cytidylyltransferase [Acetobacterium wieringae]